MATNESRPSDTLPEGSAASEPGPTDLIELVEAILEAGLAAIIKDGYLTRLSKIVHTQSLRMNTAKLQVTMGTWEPDKRQAVFEGLKEYYDAAKAKDDVGELCRLLDVHVAFEVALYDDTRQIQSFVKIFAEDERKALLTWVRKKFDKEVCAGKPGDKELSTRIPNFDIPASFMQAIIAHASTYSVSIHPVLPPATEAKPEPANLAELLDWLEEDARDGLERYCSGDENHWKLEQQGLSRRMRELKKTYSSSNEDTEVVFEGLKQRFEAAKAARASWKLCSLLDLHIKFDLLLDENKDHYEKTLGFSLAKRKAIWRKIRNRHMEHLLSSEPSEEEAQKRSDEFFYLISEIIKTESEVYDALNPDVMVDFFSDFKANPEELLSSIDDERKNLLAMLGYDEKGGSETYSENHTKYLCSLYGIEASDDHMENIKSLISHVSSKNTE